MTSVERITRLARGSALACVVIGVGVPLATLIGLLNTPDARLFAPLGFASLDHVTAWQAALARALALVPALGGGAALVILSEGFRRLARGPLFSDDVVRALGRFAFVIAAATCFAMATPTLTSLLLSAYAPPDGGRLTVQLGSAHAFGLLAALAVWTFSKLMVEARRLEQENQEFV